MIERRLQARDANHAQELALDLLDQGFDLFRGQVDSSWEVRPSAMRLQGVPYRDAAMRMVRFAAYCRQELSSLGMDYDWDDIFAIAQHYGVATNLLDFTRDPAIGIYFAADLGQDTDDTENRSRPSSGVLLAARSSDIKHDDEQEGRKLLRVIEIATANLWRLEAQKGMFIEIRAFDAYLLRLTAIEFPHCEDVAPAISRNRIYPEAKSALEIDLEGYFARERREAHQAMMREMGTFHFVRSSPPVHQSAPGITPRINSSDHGLTEAQHDEEAAIHRQLNSARAFPPNRPIHLLSKGYFVSQMVFKTGALSPDQSWFSNENWRGRIVEAFEHSGVRNRSESISLRNGLGGIDEIFDHLFSQFQAIEDFSRLRGESIEFSIAPEESFGKGAARVTDTLEALWDGLRNLPVTDHEFQECLARYCAWEAVAAERDMTVERLYTDTNGDEEDRDYFRAETVAIGLPAQQYYFAARSADSMLRKDLFDLVEVVGEIGFPSLTAWLISQVNFPQYLFDFNEFARVYITEALPATLAIYTSISPCYNPMQFKVFGRR